MEYFSCITVGSWSVLSNQPIKQELTLSLASVEPNFR